jgi:MFS transporter, ACS family, tartrate transporter
MNQSDLFDSRPASATRWSSVFIFDAKRLDSPRPAASLSMSIPPTTSLDRARRKAYIRLLPLLFVSYAIAYVDRINVSLAKLEMSKDLPGFNDKVIGFGAGVFFIGYFLLEIPGTLIVEKWSARKWISRIMTSWGIVAAITAFIHYRVPGVTWLAECAVGGIAAIFEPFVHSNLGWLSRQSQLIVESLRGPDSPFILQFFSIRFLLGLAEAGFFPGVIVYLTHWFPARDRARALSWFFIATPVAQFISPKLSYYLLRIGTTETFSNNVMIHHPALWGMQGWQWMYIAWGIPAVILGILVFWHLPDWPREARWLTPDERDALEQELLREKEQHKQGHRHMTVLQALQHPQILLLAAAYFFVVTASYGVEFFLPSILENWYDLPLRQLTWAMLIPPIGGLIGQLLVGWSSDRTGERRLHGSVPIYAGAGALGCTLLIPASLSFNIRLALAVSLFTMALMGLKAYMPAFWALPSLILTESAAAGSIGLINSVGNLGGFVGPFLLGYIETETHSFWPGLLYLCFSMIVSATIILTLDLGHRIAGPPVRHKAQAESLPDEEPDAIIEPV